MSKRAWWQDGVIYQIYPRSFQDSGLIANAHGVGDLRGIQDRLDYLVDLGIDAIWISPIFLSPMVDFGYDVADYCAIDPLFGTLPDFDSLVTAAHARGLKVLLDFVPNHSSDQHAWFKDSRSSRLSARRDWYLWRDPAPDGGPPNNWISDFGGPAWTFDAASGQYYYHAFLPEQPDLNWRNPDVRRAMFAAMRFWFDRGVDGFRIDVLWHMIKAKDFRDNPLNPLYRFDQGEMFKVLQTHSTDQPEVFEIVREMRALSDEYPERVLIGEIYLPFDRLAKYYGENLDGVQMPFNFQLIQTEWSAAAIHALIAQYEASLPMGAWPNWVLGNHDRSRIASRVGAEQARLAAMLLLTLRGTPTLYYGDELGLCDVEIDPQAAVDPRELREPGLGLGRDPERTPMPWAADAPHAGFSQRTPWLPLNKDFRVTNVANLRKFPDSILNLYRALLRLRKKSQALREGSIELHDVQGDVLMYSRITSGEHVLAVLNFGGTQASVTLPFSDLRAIFSTRKFELNEDVTDPFTKLEAGEGRLYRVRQPW